MVEVLLFIPCLNIIVLYMNNSVISLSVEAVTLDTITGNV